MNIKKPKKQPFVYVNEYVRKTIVVVNKMSENYTKPILYIPKDSNGKPLLGKGNYWYVSFYYKNPLTNEFNWDRPIIIKKGINRFKKISQRKAFGKELLIELEKLLQEGWSPYENTEFTPENNKQKLTIVEALNYALEHKTNEVKQSTIEDYKNRKDNFISWLISKNLQHIYIDELTGVHFSSYLNFVSKTSSNRNVNNHKSVISALLTKLVNDGVLKNNIVLPIKNRPSKPKMHKAFTRKEIERLKIYLKKNDPYLYYFMSVAAYSFLRPVEVLRLKVKDIDLNNWTISVETKTDNLEIIPIINTIRPIFEGFELHKYNKDDYVFTKHEHPGKWETKLERYKVGYIAKKFKKTREILNLDFENTLYGMRHTFAIDLYKHFTNKGLNKQEAILKMMPITRHDSEAGLKNYLRSINAFKVEDYSDKFTLDF